MDRVRDVFLACMRECACDRCTHANDRERTARLEAHMAWIETINGRYQENGTVVDIDTMSDEQIRAEFARCELIETIQAMKKQNLTPE